ncbi:hypothetical protein THIOKS11710067 [Thiocapsa sp. KS1]|nr:hypothetical protein THIOKS11710067 [Thiocapsa sp. KS1]
MIYIRSWAGAILYRGGPRKIFASFAPLRFKLGRARQLPTARRAATDMTIRQRGHP